MGRPKALLAIDGSTAIDRVAESLRAGGCAPVVAVVGAHAAETRSGARLRDVVVVDHPGWAAGRTSSIQAGMKSLPPDADAFVLALVDMPYVRATTVQTLVRAHAAAPADVGAVVPTHDGRRGHPVVLRRPLFARVAALGPDAPLSTVVRAATVLEVACDDPGVLVDLDTPEDL